MKITDLSTPVFGGGKSGGGALKQITLLSVTTAPTGTFEKGSQYYNSSDKKIYIAVEDNSWENAKVENPQFGVIYIFDNQGTTEYYQWDGDNLVETDLEKYQLVSNISQDFEENSETKYPSSKALREGLNSLKTLPTIVTDSGSSLPVDLTGYNEEDTFLNTTDKKIYKAEAIGYELNTNTTKGEFAYASGGHLPLVNVDSITGIATGFILAQTTGTSYICRTGVSKRWVGEVDYKIHFKMNSDIGSTLNNLLYIVNDLNYVQYGQNTTNVVIGIRNNQLYIQSFSYYSQMGSASSSQLVSPLLLLDIVLDKDKEYFLTVSKKANGVVVTSISETSYTENILETKEVSTGIEDVNNYSNTCTLYYGSRSYSGSSTATQYVTNFGNGFSNGQIYLLDSSGEFLTKSSVLSWDSGIDLTDNTGYADETNGIFYFYKDEELTKITSLAETITIDTASVTIDKIKANKNYILSNVALTEITFSDCETSFQETTIEFSTGSNAPTFIDNSGITWVDGAPLLNANKSYLIVIFNKLGLVKEY